MALRYLLDTDTLSDLIRNPLGSIAERIRRAGEDRVCTSIVVASELRFGAAKRGSDRLSSQMNTILSLLTVLPLETPADQRYGELRHYLERNGMPIGSNDMLIAAHSLAHGLTVVTGNDAEFSRVPGLRVENWLR